MINGSMSTFCALNLCFKSVRGDWALLPVEAFVLGRACCLLHVGGDVHHSYEVIRLKKYMVQVVDQSEL